MKNKYIITFLSLALLTVITACSTTPEKTPETTITAPEASTPLGTRYSTRDRLEYMYKCIKQHGSQESATKPCGCKIDKIAEKLTPNEYESAKTFTDLSRQAGDNGAAFRDPSQSKELRKKLKEADEYAEKSCFGK